MLEKAIYQVNEYAAGAAGADAAVATDSRIKLIVTIAYIVTVLSVPVTDPASLLWLFIYPIVVSEISGIGYGTIFRRSLYILPLVALIGVFNPLLDHQAAFTFGSITIGRGWLTFVSLVLRGLLTFQALLLLVGTVGFYDVCRALQYMHCPKVLVTQLMLLYRYIGVLMQEALQMKRARTARGYGRKSYPLKMWACFAGQLYVRSVNRAARVHNAMLARGFSGEYCFSPFSNRLKKADCIYLVVWLVIFAALRFIDFTSIIGHIVIR